METFWWRQWAQLDNLGSLWVSPCRLFKEVPPVLQPLVQFSVSSFEASFNRSHLCLSTTAAAAPYYQAPNIPQDVQPDRPIGYGAFGVVWWVSLFKKRVNLHQHVTRSCVKFDPHPSWKFVECGPTESHWKKGKKKILLSLTFFVHFPISRLYLFLRIDLSRTVAERVQWALERRLLCECRESILPYVACFIPVTILVFPPLHDYTKRVVVVVDKEKLWSRVLPSHTHERRFQLSHRSRCLVLPLYIAFTPCWVKNRNGNYTNTHTRKVFLIFRILERDVEV